MAHLGHVHIGARASGFKGGTAYVSNSKSWGSAARLYLDFPKAGCCAVSLLEMGHAAFGSVWFVFKDFYHLLNLSCVMPGVGWRCRGSQAQNELALGFGINFNKGFHLDTRAVFAGCHI